MPDQLSHSAVDHYMRGNTVVHCVADLQAKEMISVAPIVVAVATTNSCSSISFNVAEPTSEGE